MILDKAKQIEGWMYDPELEWLAEQASKHKNIIEVGCALGRSTRVLADNTFGTVHAIDPWDEEWYGPTGFKGLGRNNTYNEFCFNLMEHIMVGRVIIYRVPFEDFVPQGNYDMIFIDGDHEYPSVKDDILRAKRISPNGLICGHDYMPDHPGVMKAVDEEFSDIDVIFTIWAAKNAT